MIGRRLVLVALGALSSLLAVAVPPEGSCRTQGKGITPSSVAVSGALVREWSETYNEWYDGAPTNTAAANQYGGYWCKVTLTRGKPYVLAISDALDLKVGMPPASVVSYTRFSSCKVAGTTYLYVNADDWASIDPSVADFYVHLIGGYGRVGSAFSFTLQQRSISEILPEAPGTDANPIVLDVTDDSSILIAKEPNGYWTTYSAALQAGERYVFKGIASAPGKDVLVTLGSKEWVDFPGTWAFDSEVHTLTLTMTADHVTTIRVMADDEGLSWSVAGGMLSWKVGAPAEPTSAGTYRGHLLDCDEERVSADFAVVMRVMDDATTNYSARVTVNGVERSYEDAGNGEIIGSVTIGGVEYDSYFYLETTVSGALTIDGSLYVDDAGDAREFFFKGELTGALVPWEDSLLPFDPLHDSAADMGITASAFKDEPASSPALIALHRWAGDNNVAVSSVNTMSFTAAGDPSGLLSEAFLLDCAPTADVVGGEKAKFVIVRFSIEGGNPVVTVVGDRQNEDPYGNGRVEIRSSLTAGGGYTAEPKTSSDKLFFKAYLVK